MDTSRAVRRRDAEPARTADPCAPVRVMIVEDDPQAGELLETILQMEGHAVEAVQTAAEALDLLNHRPADFALIDIGLPGIDGYELARTIRGRGEHDGMTLVALTGHGEPEDRRSAREAGFDAHLVKPIDVDRLLGLLRRRPNES